MKNSKRQKSLESLVAVTHTHTHNTFSEEDGNYQYSGKIRLFRDAIISSNLCIRQ